MVRGRAAIGVATTAAATMTVVGTVRVVTVETVPGAAAMRGNVVEEVLVVLAAAVRVATGMGVVEATAAAAVAT